MKTMIKKTLLAVSASMLVSIASAQDIVQRKIMTPEEIASAQTEYMVSRLNTTPEQVEKLGEINLDFAQKIKAAKDTDAPDAVFKTLYKNHDDSVKVTLGEAEFEKLKETRRKKQNP